MQLFMQKKKIQYTALAPSLLCINLFSFDFVLCLFGRTGSRGAAHPPLLACLTVCRAAHWLTKVSGACWPPAHRNSSKMSRPPFASKICPCRSDRQGVPLGSMGVFTEPPAPLTHAAESCVIPSAPPPSSHPSLVLS